MTKILLAVMTLFVCFSIGGAQTGKKATAQEKKDLFQLVLKDKSVSDALPDLEGGEKKLAESFLVEKKDLNKDGRAEYFATLENGFFCGAHGNCPRWVYSKTGGNFTLLLTTAGQKLTTQKTISNKFFDLRSDGSSSAFETAYDIYKFDGSEYKAKDCFTVDHRGKKPKRTRIACGE